MENSIKKNSLEPERISIFSSFLLYFPCEGILIDIFEYIIK